MAALPKPDNLQVLIPYKDLLAMYEALEEIPQMRREVERYQKQVTALHGEYINVLDRLKEVMSLL